MVKSRSEKILSRRIGNGTDSMRPDNILVEEPMSIQLGDFLISTTMRTPGNDFELAAGFLLSEGYLKPGELTSIRYCGVSSPVESDFNVVSVSSTSKVKVTPRLSSVSSSCGICGTDAIHELANRLDQLPDYEPWDLDLLMRLSQTVRPLQSLFEATGSSHAAAAIDREGKALVVREDIGRHNAVDKVVGRLLLDGMVPAHELALFVTGRCSFEMVQKAWSAGFTALVAVSGPSTLAISTARSAGLTLIGFSREESATLYFPQR